jgi:hypothetical protein
MELYAPKNFPDNYPLSVIHVLEALSMSSLKGVKLVGSASIRSQLYAGDYDATDSVKVNSASDIAFELKSVIKKLRDIPECFIGDIKCGEVPDWNIFPKRSRVEDGKVMDFNVTQSKAHLDKLLHDKVITPAESKEYHELLSKADTPFGFLDAKKTIRVHILRWLPSEILRGSLEYRHHHFKLEDAILSKGMVKVDAICNISDRFTEFSMIYELTINGKKLSVPHISISDSLKEDIIYYENSNPFKALKRAFALSKLQKNYDDAETLAPIMNSDLGRLYQIIGDLKTLDALLKRPKHPMAEIRSQIDAMKSRMGNIYKLKDFLSHEHSILGSINSLLKSPMSTIVGKLNGIISELEGILNRNTIKEVEYMFKNV